MTTELAAPPKPNIQELMNRVADPKLAMSSRINSVGDVMRAAAPQMMAALPKHVTADRMIRVAMNCVRKNPKLLDCNPVSLFSAITEAATYGWELGGVLGHAYLVPFGKECTLIPGYKGLIDLCRRSGQVSTICLEVVHEGDMFDYALGDKPYVDHKPNDKDKHRDSKPITHVYCVIELRDGGKQRSVWSTEKIDAHKKRYSKSWQKSDSAWQTAWPTMGKKTVIRDMIQRGLVPLSAEYSQMVERSTVVDDDGEPFAGMDLIPDRSEGVDDFRTLDDQSQTQEHGDESDPLDKALEGIADSQDRASFYKKAINSTLDKELLARLKSVIEGDDSLDLAERDILAKYIDKRVK